MVVVVVGDYTLDILDTLDTGTLDTLDTLARHRPQPSTFALRRSFHLAPWGLGWGRLQRV